MGNLFLKSRIPDGSKLCISIGEGEGTPEGSFVGSARLVLESGAEEIWPDEQIHPGPKCKKLASANGYAWRVRVAFTSADKQTAVIRAEVRKPDGNLFGKSYEYAVTGKNGDIQRATIIAATEHEA
jgi:hypothetical protein